MKIGIKFCGGCNPKYDRKYAENILRTKLSKDYIVEYVKDKEIYEYVFIINGCQAQCASTKEFYVLKNTYSIYSLETLNKIIQKYIFCFKNKIKF